MANFHKLVVIGRLVRDPECRTFTNGGKVAKFGLPIDFTQRKKNPATGEWEGDSFIINVDAFNRDNGAKLADLVEQYLRKGSQVYIEGRLKPNEYTDKTGKLVSRPVLVADTIKFLDPRPDGGFASEDGVSAPRSAPTPARNPAPRPTPAAAPRYDEPESHGGEEAEIPF